MENNKSKLFFYISLSIVFLLVLTVFFVSVYESFSDNKLSKESIFKDPEIIAIIIGLIISILFFERWKSLESRVDKLSEGSVDTLKSIEEYTKSQIEQNFSMLETKAKSLKDSISGLVENHPWLEEIEERELIVETDSCRGILRTCYSLLREEKYLHLFEYLEYCSKKGTANEKWKNTGKLNGTADDFYELSIFCEIWLNDYYLSAEFIKRYIEQYPDSAYILMPHYLRKLIRIGDLGSVKTYSKYLRRKVYGDTIIEKLKLYFKLTYPVSEYYRWNSSHILLLADTLLCEDKWNRQYKKDLINQKYSKYYETEQLLYEIELEIQSGEFELAQEKLLSLHDKNLKMNQLNELSYLNSKIGNDEIAQELRENINDLRHYGFGDFSHVRDTEHNHAKSNSFRDNQHDNLMKEQEQENKKKREDQFRKRNFDKKKGKSNDDLDDKKREL